MDMRCPRCKAKIELGDAFCGECGCPLQDPFGEPEDNGRGNKNKTVIIVLAVLIVAVIAGFAGLFLYNYLEDKRGQDTADRIREEISEDREEKEDTQEQTEEGEETAETQEPSQDQSNSQMGGSTVSQDYIFPDSDSRYLTDADVAGLTLQEINYGKNEIYARHGRKFKSQELTNYFESKSWYNGIYEPDDFDANYSGLLNEYEKRNAEFLSEKEHERDAQGYIEDAD